MSGDHQHCDFFGRLLQVGDVVVFPAPEYRHLALGTVTSLTPQNIRISYTNTWNYGSPGVVLEYLARPNCVVKRDPG